MRYVTHMGKYVTFFTSNFSIFPHLGHKTNDSVPLGIYSFSIRSAWQLEEHCLHSTNKLLIQSMREREREKKE